MFLNKSVVLSLLFTLVLSGCSGSDGFGLGNGAGNTSTSEETTTDTGGGTETPVTVSLALGTGSGGSFITGGMTTSIGSSLLSYGGDTTVSVNIVDTSDNNLYTAGSATVNFTSGCVQSGKSEIDTTVNSSTGIAVATYKALTCEGSDTIRATLSDGSSASVLVNVAGQILGALEFVSASPVTIALKGSGSSAIPEVSTVSFSLKDKTGAAMAGETITYKLSTEVGGISLSSNSSITTAEGLTTIQLNSGGVNTSVVVTASVIITNSDGSTSTTSTTSNPIAILGGIPDQDSFSISVQTLNPRAWDVDGTTTSVTIRAADRYNNPARNGTQISFVTSGGAIVGSCPLANGSCSVNWNSQSPRPTSGLVEILARTTGEETFTDTNSNGVYDLGELVRTNLSEAYLDADQSDAYELDEFFSDFNKSGAYDAKVGTKFQGTNCSAAALADGSCANLVEVRASATLCMSTDSTVMTDSAGGIVNLAGGSQSITLGFFDAKGNMPAAGTTIAITVEDAVLVSGGTVVVPNGCASGFQHNVVVGVDDDPATVSGVLKIAITQADGIVVSYNITLNH